MGVAIVLLGADCLRQRRRNGVLHEVIGDLRRQLDTLNYADHPVAAGGDAAADAAADGAEGDAATDEDAALFAAIDRQIDEGQLFLDPNFGRDSICRLTGLSKERVGQLIKRFGGVGNLQVYVNRKRAAYAKGLMRSHVNYTMEAIANECGIGNLSTFYRIFKQVFGVSPAEFRRSLADGAGGE
ncbi:MAG: helix-turn-helix domain-containing protein [Prevotella sp.]|nr:helix-turn-helix domain-containing protein [Prevotella sp.]